MRIFKRALTYIGMALVALGVVAGIVALFETGPSGVREVVWDKQPCRECGMSVSDREFACQLQTHTGDVHDFDDPGCLFQYVLREKPQIKATFFREIDANAWLSGDDAGFVPTKRSPMDYGIAAVARSKTPKAIPFDDALHEFAKQHAKVSDQGE